jgi:small conductance mechanosensitive channel
MSAWQIAVDAGVSVAIVVGAMLLVWAVKRLVGWALRRLPGPHTADRTIRMTRITRLTTAVARLLAAIGAVVMVLNVWGLDISAWASRTLGPEFEAAGLRMLLLLLVAAAAFEAAGFAIGWLFSGVAANAHEVRRQAQLKTLGPVIQRVAQTTIVVVAGLMAMSEIGVKIGPLIAGAGVIGIALGFGAQTLVKDFLTGMFLIIEDIVSVGDVVRIGDSGGLVEQMTLRTIRLRDFDGTLHVFPYGEAQVVHNLTKTFSYYVFNLQISYGADIDEAMSIMRRVGAGMQAEAAYADLILDPIEVVGVDNLADSGVVLKARIKTQPIQQWTVGREYNRRIKLAFDEAGIEIPFPHMKIVLPDQPVPGLDGHASPTARDEAVGSGPPRPM